MTIYEIAERVKNSAPFFFSKDTLRFFGQKMESFNVQPQDDGRFLISAKSWWPNENGKGKKSFGTTVRFFNPKTNELDFK